MGLGNGVPPEREFSRLTWQEVAAMADRERTVLILPMGAIEQHGPHLPLMVDHAIAIGVIGQAVARLDPAVAAYVLPPLPYGKSNEHGAFPGTISLTATTLLATVMDIGDSLYRSGFRKLILVNGHGGQPPVLDIAATDLHDRYPTMEVLSIFVWRAAPTYKALLGDREGAEGMHAGDAETSLMLALRPDAVRRDRADCVYPPDRLPGSAIGPKGPLAYAWRTEELSASGTIGDATAASREKGERLLDLLADGWATLITEVYHLPPPRSRDR